MGSARDLLERAGRSAPSPAFGLDDLERRRDRRRARQRIGTAAVALTLAAAVAGIALAFAGLRDGRGTVVGSTGSIGVPGALPAPTAAPVLAGPGQYYYSRTWQHAADSCGGSQDPMTCTYSTTEIETWWATDEAGRIVSGDGSETYAPGEFPNDTVTTGLPTDPARLRDALYSRSGPDGASPEPQTTVSPGQDGMDASVEQSIVNLLGMANTTPALRAALLEVLAGMPDAIIELDATDPAGRPAYRITVTTFGGPTVHELYVDPATHELLAHVQTGSDGTLWFELVLESAGVTDGTSDAATESVVPPPIALPEVSRRSSPAN
jgi:hypothetical protein